MPIGLKGNSDGSGAIQIGGSDAISISTGLNTTFAGTITASGGVMYPLTSGTAIASTSGTSIDFTGIPSWVKRITVMFREVSLNGSAHFLVQIGSSGTPTTTGYVSSASISIGSNQVLSVSSTSGFVAYGGNTVNLFSGAITLLNISGNVWVATQGGTLANYSATGGGSVSLSGTLNIVRITTTNGTDAFDAGTINILYE